MRKRIQLLLLVSILPLLAIAQTPKRVHDLKSLTDSSGTVHLFYRIYAEYEGTDYSTNNIYHYNTETREEYLFLEDYYDTHLGFEYQILINGYKFFENDPSEFIYYGSDNDGIGFITRYDSLGFLGFLVFPKNVEITESDSSLIYGTFAGYGTFKSLDGGITWPDDEKIRDEKVPDSLKLNFPLVSLSPYDDSLMFGAGTSFVRSTDAGLTYDVLEFYTADRELYYDSDSIHIYAMNTENCSSSLGCEYYLYNSSQKGAPESWQKLQVFKTNKQISVHPGSSGELYLWGKDSIYVSKDYAESIEYLYDSGNEEITGVSVEGETVFITTISSLYKLENNDLTLLRQILVNTEEAIGIPSSIQLHQNYPNPFNPSTIISFDLAKPQNVTLQVYDVLGNLVQTLVDKNLLSTGEHQYKWNPESHLSSGVYFYKLQTNKESVTSKMILIK